MLRVPAPFPQVGSYPLIEIDGRLQLARIVGRDHGGNALISLPLDPVAASGNKSVPLEQLLNADPLSAQERAELQSLDREIRAAKRPNRARVARRDALERRDQLHCARAPLMARLPASLKNAA